MYSSGSPYIICLIGEAFILYHSVLVGIEGLRYDEVDDDHYQEQ